MSANLFQYSSLRSDIALPPLLLADGPSYLRCSNLPHLLESLPHGHDVLWRHVVLDVVNGAENESPAGRQVLDPLHNLLPDSLGAGAGERVRVHSPTPEHEIAPKLTLEPGEG